MKTVNPVKQGVHKYNKANAIREFQKQFSIGFEMEKDAIDLRAMSENYHSGIIPVEDIHIALQVYLGPQTGSSSVYDYDPGLGASYTQPNRVMKFDYIDWNDLYLWPKFQRDVAPNHIMKIVDDFRHTAVMTASGIKLTIDGKPIYCLWDGHHTTQVCRFKGYSRMPVAYIDLDEIPDSEIIAAGKSDRLEYGCWLAGKNMISINSKNKRALSAHDEFMINLDIRDQFVTSVHAIIASNGYNMHRHKSSGCFSQPAAALDCYWWSANGIGGVNFSRALKFHKQHWPRTAAELEIWRPMCALYYLAEGLRIPLDEQFDVEMGELLIKHYGRPCVAQERIKDSYESSFYGTTGKLTGSEPPKINHQIVMNGLISLYNEHCGRIPLSPPNYSWKVV